MCACARKRETEEIIGKERGENIKWCGFVSSAAFLPLNN